MLPKRELTSKSKCLPDTRTAIASDHAHWHPTSNPPHRPLSSHRTVAIKSTKMQSMKQSRCASVGSKTLLPVTARHPTEQEKYSGRRGRGSKSMSMKHWQMPKCVSRRARCEMTWRHIHDSSTLHRTRRTSATQHRPLRTLVRSEFRDCQE
jgi:hypothetical protein